MLFLHDPEELISIYRLCTDKEKEKEKEDDDKPRTSGKGDPLMMAFDGSLFFFHGEPGKIYDFASIAGGFQVSTSPSLYLNHFFVTLG